MKTPDIKKQLQRLRDSSVMICEWDTHAMRAAVFQRKKKTLQITARAASDEALPDRALADIVNDLRKQGWQGKNVIVLTPSAVNTLVELPVTPKKPKPVEQMHELVRWEAEPVLMQHQLQWSIGQLLRNRGLLTHEQVSEVSEKQKRQQRAAGQSAIRFGDMAVEMGYATEDDITHSNELQDWLSGEDDQIICGWSGQGEVADAPGVWQWWVSAIYSAVVDKWDELCRDLDLNLTGMMPLTGNALALADTESKATMLLETSTLSTSAMLIQRQNVTAVSEFIHPQQENDTACLEAYHAINAPAKVAIQLACPAVQLPELARHLEDTLDSTPTVLPASEQAGVSPGMQAVAQHVFRLDGHKRICLIRRSGPQPPPMYRQEVQATALVAGLFLLIIATEVVQIIEHRQVAAEKAEIDERAEVLDAAVERIEKQKEAINAKKAELEKQRADQERMQARLDFFGQKLPERALLVQAVLGLLQSTVSEQIVLNRIDEMGRRVGLREDQAPTIRPGMVELDNFNVDAWAMTESAAQEFVQNMKVASAPWDMEVRDIQVFEKIGPMKMEGFAVSMSLLRVKEASTEGSGS